jgi:hypothetical protein
VRSEGMWTTQGKDGKDVEERMGGGGRRIDDGE